MRSTRSGTCTEQRVRPQPTRAERQWFAELRAQPERLVDHPLSQPHAFLKGSGEQHPGPAGRREHVDEPLRHLRTDDFPVAYPVLHERDRHVIGDEVEGIPVGNLRPRAPALQAEVAPLPDGGRDRVGVAHEHR